MVGEQGVEGGEREASMCWAGVSFGDEGRPGYFVRER